MTANYEKEQRELLKLVADGKKKLQDAGQTKVDLRLLIRRIEVHNKDKADKKVKVDIYFTAVGLFSVPTGKEMLSAMGEIRQNPQQFKFSA